MQVVKRGLTASIVVSAVLVGASTGPTGATTALIQPEPTILVDGRLAEALGADPDEVIRLGAQGLRQLEDEVRVVAVEEVPTAALSQMLGSLSYPGALASVRSSMSTTAELFAQSGDSVFVMLRKERASSGRMILSIAAWHQGTGASIQSLIEPVGGNLYDYTVWFGGQDEPVATAENYETEATSAYYTDCSQEQTVGSCSDIWTVGGSVTGLACAGSALNPACEASAIGFGLAGLICWQSDGQPQWATGPCPERQVWHQPDSNCRYNGCVLSVAMPKNSPYGYPTSVTGAVTFRTRVGGNLNSIFSSWMADPDPPGVTRFTYRYQSNTIVIDASCGSTVTASYYTTWNDGFQSYHEDQGIMQNSCP